MLERFQDPDGFVGYRSSSLAELGVPHLFTTRLGGGRRDFDLGELDGAGYQRLFGAAHAGEAALVRCHQVHGAQVLVVGPGALPDGRAQADALVSERADALLCIHVADCVPILLAARGGARVAAVHAGWRGVVAGVVARTLELLGGADTVAAIGPCISAPAFEVGPEVSDAFTRIGLAHTLVPHPGARAHIDLRAAVEHQLHAGGVRRIDSTERCTYRDSEEFFSYRRDVTHGGRGRTGRLGALIGPRRS